MRLIVLFITLMAVPVAWPAATPERSPIKSPQISTNNSPAAVAAVKNQGSRTAPEDIDAGILQILYFGKPWSQGKPMVDEATGYRVQIVGGCVVSRSFVAEVEGYNNTMRDWHTKTKKKASAEENIRETVFRYQLSNSVVIPQDTKVVFLMLGKRPLDASDDPTKKFLQRFANEKLPVRKVSKSRMPYLTDGS
jgi:hypothetical protein